MENNTLVEERFKILFGQQMVKYEKQVTLLKDTIQGLAMEIQALKSQMADVSQLKQQMRETPRREETQKPLSSEKAPHPRQGNYKPEDVDIKKMFYFGHK